MIRLGLIGCGEHSESGHAIPLARYKATHPDEILLAAACDLSFDRATEFSRKYGFARAYQNFDQMFDHERLDGCIAVVPPANISLLGIKLLERGIPCVVEKPLGTSLAEVKALGNAAAMSQTFNMVSVNRRFMPSLNRALEWIKTTGGIRYVHCTMSRHARSEPEFLWTTAVHAVDTLRYIAGSVISFELRPMKAAAMSDVWYAIDLHFESGIAGRIDVLPTAGMVEETYDLFGAGFRVTVTCPFGPKRGWRCFKDGHLVWDEIASDDLPEDVVNGCYDETVEFIRAVRTQSPPTPSIAEVMPSVELCLAMAERASK